MRSINHAAIPRTMGGAAAVGSEGRGGDTGGLQALGWAQAGPASRQAPGCCVDSAPHDCPGALPWECGPASGRSRQEILQLRFEV